MNRSAPERAKQVKLYSRDELKITSLLEGYRSVSCLNVVKNRARLCLARRRDPCFTNRRLKSCKDADCKARPTNWHTE